MHVPIVSGYADVPVDAQSTGIEGYRLLVFVKRPMNIPVSLRRGRDFLFLKEKTMNQNLFKELASLVPAQLDAGQVFTGTPTGKAVNRIPNDLW